MRFYNAVQKNMSFSDVVASIKYFIKLNPDSRFRLAVGTDSAERGRHTFFITGIRIQRMGHGAWHCVNRHMECKRYADPREKKAREAFITYEFAGMLKEQLIEGLRGLISESGKLELRLEAHMDTGENGGMQKLLQQIR